MAFTRTVLAAVERLPGVRAASTAAVTPLQGGGMSLPVLVNGESTGDEEVYFNVIGPRYFEIMQTPILEGREFTASDDDSRPAVAIVNDAFVRRHLTNGLPLGQRVSITGTPREMQIVGVARDAVYETLRAGPPPTVYVSYQQHRGRPMTLLVDAPGSAAAVVDAIRAEVQPRVPARPLQFRTLAAQVEDSLIRERLMMAVTTLFGALALLLAAVGLYGLVSYSVTSRTREIGVRIALGARQAVIQRSVLSDALRLVAFGAAIGMPAAWLLSRGVASLMFGIRPADLATMIGAAAVLAAAGAIAAAGPARRAARVDPIVSLRAE
jgi:predicted permease